MPHWQLLAVTCQSRSWRCNSVTGFGPCWGVRRNTGFLRYARTCWDTLRIQGPRRRPSRLRWRWRSHSRLYGRSSSVWQRTSKCSTSAVAMPSIPITPYLNKKMMMKVMMCWVVDPMDLIDLMDLVDLLDLCCEERSQTHQRSCGTCTPGSHDNGRNVLQQKNFHHVRSRDPGDLGRTKGQPRCNHAVRASM